MSEPIPGLTVGRMVHYVGYPNGDEPALHIAAIVVDVHPDNSVNLTTFNRVGWTDSEIGVGYDPTGEEMDSFHFIERA